MLSLNIKCSLDTSNLQKIKAAVEREANKSVQVGWFDTTDHPDRLARAKNHSTVAGVAFRNEFGIKRGDGGADEFGVPERPFIRPTILWYTREWQINSLKRIARAALTDKDTTGRRKALGKHLVNELRKTIDNRKHTGKKDNSEFIAERKGFNHPLKGKTDILRNSIRHRLVDNGVE